MKNEHVISGKQLVLGTAWNIVFIIAGDSFATAKDAQGCYVNQLVPPCPVTLGIAQQQPWLKSCRPFLCSPCASLLFTRPCCSPLPAVEPALLPTNTPPPSSKLV